MWGVAPGSIAWRCCSDCGTAGIEGHVPYLGEGLQKGWRDTSMGSRCKVGAYFLFDAKEEVSSDFTVSYVLRWGSLQRWQRPFPTLLEPSSAPHPPMYGACPSMPAVPRSLRFCWVLPPAAPASSSCSFKVRL